MVNIIRFAAEPLMPSGLLQFRNNKTLCEEVFLCGYA